MTWSGGTFASFKAACESSSVSVLPVLEVTLPDPDGKTGTGTVTIYLSDRFHQRTATPDYFIPAVQAWGDLNIEAAIGSGPVPPTFEVLLTHERFGALTTTPPGTVTTLSPTPEQDELGSDEYLRWYQWVGAPVTWRMYVIGSGHTSIVDADSQDVSQALFQGRIVEADPSSDGLLLRMEGNHRELQVRIEGREIDEPSIDTGLNRGKRLPIVYGTWGPRPDQIPGDFVGFHAAMVGVKFGVIPVVGLELDATTTTDKRYAWADFAHPNRTSQPDFGTGAAPVAEDMLLQYNQDSASWTFCIANPGVDGFFTWEDDNVGGSNDLGSVLVHGWLTGEVYLPCRSVLARRSISGTPVTVDEDKMIDGSLLTRGTMRADVVGYVTFNITSSVQLGKIYDETEFYVHWLFNQVGLSCSSPCAGTIRCHIQPDTTGTAIWEQSWTPGALFLTYTRYNGQAQNSGGGNLVIANLVQPAMQWNWTYQEQIGFTLLEMNCQLRITTGSGIGGEKVGIAGMVFAFRAELKENFVPVSAPSMLTRRQYERMVDEGVPLEPRFPGSGIRNPWNRRGRRRPF